MRGLDPRIHLKEESIEEDGLPGQARQRHSWQKIEGWAKAHLAPCPPSPNETPRGGHACALPTATRAPSATLFKRMDCRVKPGNDVGSNYFSSSEASRRSIRVCEAP